MGRILTTFIGIWLGLSPLFGQRLLVRQSIEGFRGSGEIHAYSSSRIFLQLNKDGEWPRQIQWEIQSDGQAMCGITFNKVGWQYTSSTDSCGLDWMRLDSDSFTHRLFVVQSTPSPSETIPNRVAESLLLTRTPKIPVPRPSEQESERPQAQATTSPQSARNEISASAVDPTVEATSVPPSIKNVQADSATLFLVVLPGDPIETASTEATPQILRLDTIAQIDEIAQRSSFSAANTDAPKESYGKTLLDTTSVLAPSMDQADTPRRDMPVNPSVLSQGSPSTISSAATSDTPEYIFTVPDYQPRRSWFGRKKKPEPMAEPLAPEPLAPSSLENIPLKDADEIEELDSQPQKPAPSESTLSSELANDTSVYLQTAPFISVASFETLEYTQQVLQQFTCPGGCIIVRSEKGFYYRIGFYPDPKNIAVVLREIRKKYSDAWLVN